nr:ABC transporter substrate-binding protein [Hyphomonas sp. Mor2]
MMIRILFASMLSFIVSACGSSGEDGIRLTGWVSSPVEDELVREMVAEFSAENPEILLKYHPIQANYPQKLQLMLGTNTAPEVFMLEAFWAPAMINYEVLAPLDDLVKSDAEFAVDDFEPALLAAFEQDGKLYGIPKDYSTLALFYNPDMLADAGFDRPPATWAELELYAQALSVDLDGDGQTDRYGLGVDPSLEYLLPFVWQNGGEILDEDGKFDAGNPALKDTLTWLQSLKQRGWLGHSTDVGGAWNMDGFGRERFAMALSGNWAVNFMDETFPGTPYEIAELPAGKERASIAYVVGYVMPAQSENTQQAWTLLSYLTSIHGQQRWVERGIALPPRQSIAAKARLEDDPKTAAFVRSAAYARTWQVGSNQRVLDEAETMLQSIFLLDRPVEDALERMANRLENAR